MDELERALNEGKAHHRAGRLVEAEKIYRDVLARSPRHADAMHCLGLLAVQAGHVDAGLNLMARSVQLAPRDWKLHLNYGVQLNRAGRPAEAVEPLRRAIELGGATHEKCTELGTALL